MTVRGMRSLQRKLENMRDDLEDEVNDEVQKGAIQTAEQARTNIATSNTFWTGNLSRNMYATRGVSVGGVTRYKIVADVPYAAFVEFGTGIRGDPSAPVQFQFGTPEHTPELTGEILAWVMTKPVFFGPRTSGVAWAIAKKIAKLGTHPHPFLRPAWFRMEEQIKLRSRLAVKKVVRRA